MMATSVKRTQESALKEEHSQKNRENIKDGIGRNTCESKLSDVQKLTERLLEKRIGVRRFTAVGVRVYTTGLRIRARRTVLRLAEEINRVSLSKIPYN